MSPDVLCREFHGPGLPLEHDFLRRVDQIPVGPVDDGHADDGGADSDRVSDARETRGLHFDVLHPDVGHPTQVREFVRLGELANGAVDSALTLVEVVRADGFAGLHGQVDALADVDEFGG